MECCPSGWRSMIGNHVYGLYLYREFESLTLRWRIFFAIMCISFIEYFSKKVLDFWKSSGIVIYVLNCEIWPVGQVVKTPPFHGGNMSSNLVRVITILNMVVGGLAQLVEHLPYKQEVTGSSPVSSIESLAQLVEHLTFNQRIGSSSLPRLIGPEKLKRVWRNWQTR